MTGRAREWRWGPGRRGLVRPAVLVAVAVGLGGLATSLGLSVVGPAPTASADPVADCTTTTGVVVAVDFRPFGGQIQAGCDPTTTTGLAAMEVAGFTPTGTSQYGDAFVCLIDGYPQSQSCTSTPPASASWSFWLADAGATAWTYSPGGAATLQPRPGSVEAWTFGSSNPDVRPGFPPSVVRATTPGPTPPATTTTTTPGAASGAPTGAGGGGSGDATTPATGQTAGSAGGPVTSAGGESGAATGPAATTTSRPGATAGTSSDPAGAAHAASTSDGSTAHGSSAHGSTPDGTTPHGSAAPVVVAAAPTATDTHGSSGSPLPVVVTVLAVVVLGGAAALVTRRRRRSA